MSGSFIIRIGSEPSTAHESETSPVLESISMAAPEPASSALRVAPLLPMRTAIRSFGTLTVVSIGLADLPPLFQAVEWELSRILLKITKKNDSPSAREQGGVCPEKSAIQHQHIV